MKLPVINQTAWINRGNRPEKVTARGVRIPQSKAGSIGGKGIHMTAPGIGAVMQAPRQFRSTDLHRANQAKPAKRVEVPKRVRAVRVRVVRQEETVRAEKLVAPKPRICHVCGLPCPSRKTWGKHYSEAHFSELGKPTWESEVGA